MAEQQGAVAEEAPEELEVIETPDGLPPADESEQSSEGQQQPSDDDEDERLGEGEEDEQPTDKRRARRERRRQSRENKDRLLDRLVSENRELVNRLANLENTQLATSHMTLDHRLNTARTTYASASDIMRKAEESGNIADVIEAMRIRDAAAAEVTALEPEVQRLMQARQQPQQPQPQGPPPEAVSLQNAWREANPWYTDNPSDNNSAIARAISNQLVGEGLMPTSIDHWREVTRRLNEMAGANNQQEAPRQRKGPPVNATRTGAAAANPGNNRVYLSADRVQAIKGMGRWEDKTQRDAMIRAYQKWDRENAGRN